MGEKANARWCHWALMWGATIPEMTGVWDRRIWQAVSVNINVFLPSYTKLADKTLMKMSISRLTDWQEHFVLNCTFIILVSHCRRCKWSLVESRAFSQRLGNSASSIKNANRCAILPSNMMSSASPCRACSFWRMQASAFEYGEYWLKLRWIAKTRACSFYRMCHNLMVHNGPIIFPGQQDSCGCHLWISS